MSDYKNRNGLKMISMHSNRNMKNCQLILRFALSAFILLVSSNVVFANDYYVSPAGNNANDGLSLSTAWSGLNHAADTIVAGDTVYVVNGTYYPYNDIDFKHSGTDTHPIKMVAYNGTPLILGSIAEGTINFNGKQYINVSGVELFSSLRKVKITGSNNTLHNCILSGSGTGANTIHLGDNASYINIIDCTFYNQSGGANLMDLVTNYASGIVMHDVVIHNNTFYDISGHNVINFYDQKNDEIHRTHWNFTLTNNTVYNAYTNCIVFATNHVNLYDSTISNNTIYDASTGISLYLKNSVVSNNIAYNIDYDPALGTNDRYVYDVIYDSNNAEHYLCGKNITIINPLQSVQIRSSGSTVTMKDWDGSKTVALKYGGGVTLEQTDGRAHTITKKGGIGSYVITTPKYYPTKSNSSIDLTNDPTTYFTITTYNIAIKPSTGYLTVPLVSETALTVHSDISNNPTWVSIIRPEYAGKTIELYVDGAPYGSQAADSTGLASFYYTGVWDSDHTFTWSVTEDAPSDNPPTALISSDRTTNTGENLFLDGSASSDDNGIASYITAASGKNYVLDTLDTGKLQYIDRSYTFSSVPSSYINLKYIRTANDDKGYTANPYLEFDVKQDVTVYVAHDDRISPKPSWLSSFTDTGDDLVGGGGTFSLYANNFSAGHICLGGNYGDSYSMYNVVLKPLTSSTFVNNPPELEAIGDKIVDEGQTALS